MKRFFKKLLSFLIFCAVIYGVWYFQQDWIRHQLDKVKGIYYVYKADQAYAQDNMGKTLELYNRGLDYFPEHYEAWFNLGNIYVVYEDYFSAIDAYKNAIKYNPNYVLARMNLGIIYSERLGFFDEAIEQFNIIHGINDGWSIWIPKVYNNVRSKRENKGVAFYNIGIAYRQKATYLPIEKKYMMNQYLQDAVSAYTSALKYLKNNYDVYYNRAIAYHIKGDYKLAGKDYCTAIKLKPTKFEAHYNLAILLKNLHRYWDAKTELEKAAMLITENSDSSELQTTYIFNVLNEVSRQFITSNEYGVEKLTDKPTGSIAYTYVNGRIVADDDFDKAMEENFKTCAGIDFFNKNYEEDEY